MLSGCCSSITALISSFGCETVFRVPDFNGGGERKKKGSEVPLSALEISDKIQLLLSYIVSTLGTGFLSSLNRINMLIQKKKHIFKAS